MPRPRCLLCDNVGQVIEFRLVWLRKGLEGSPPAKCSRRVESQEEGVERIKDLAENEYDPQVLSCGRACPNCGAGRAATAQAAAARKAEPPKHDPPPVEWRQGEWPARRDWKMAAAGDRDD